MSAMNVSTSSQSNFLVNLRKKYFNHLIIANLNINSLPNKFEDLKILVKGKVDTIVITESKLNHTFPYSSLQNDDLLFRKLSNQIDFYSKTYDNFFIAGDLNCQEIEPILSEFLNMHSAKNIVKEETCFKSIENPNCINLF